MSSVLASGSNSSFRGFSKCNNPKEPHLNVPLSLDEATCIVDVTSKRYHRYCVCHEKVDNSYAFYASD